MTPDDFLAYVYGALAQPAFTARYAKELDTRELRVPITKDAALFGKLHDAGARLLWLHSYGERFVPRGKQLGEVPRGAAKCVRPIPGGPDGYPESFHYNDTTRTLHVGDGELRPVTREVYERVAADGWTAVVRGSVAPSDVSGGSAPAAEPWAFWREDLCRPLTLTLSQRAREWQAMPPYNIVTHPRGLHHALLSVRDMVHTMEPCAAGHLRARRCVSVSGLRLTPDAGMRTSPAILTLYTKPECGLCDEVKATLQAVQRDVPFEVVEIDITGDPALYDRFREEIPVGFLDGRKLFKYRVDPALLRRQLRRRCGWLAGRWFQPRGS